MKKKKLTFLLFTLLFIMTLFISTENNVIFSTPQVYAATNKTTKIEFSDDSGKYLLSKNNNYYLYSQNNKPLSGPQYLNVKTTKLQKKGYYFFDKNGCLIQKQAVYKFDNKKVNGVVFDGYHYANKDGRFYSSEVGLRYLKNLKCGSQTFTGIYYLNTYGRLSASACTRLIQAQTIGGKTLVKGYYYFNKDGKLCTEKHFHYINQKVGKTRLKGSYFFGLNNGKLRTKEGFLTFNNHKYYTDRNGKRLTNQWVSEYYLQSNGRVAISKQVPDGSYVDDTGRKCTKEQFLMGPLKKQIQQIANSYGGTYSVYVKDLKTGAVINYNDMAMYPASTIKAFVMATVFDQIKNKKLSYSSTIKYYLDRMITVSDNESYNVLVRTIGNGSFVNGAKIVNNYLRKHGYSKTGCHTTLHPAYSAFQSDGGSNSSCAKDCGLLLEKIYKNTCVSKTYSKEMLNLLLRQTRTWKIPYVLPSGVKTANKTGETSTTQHDMAIVYGPKTHYILCVFSQNAGEYTLNSGIQRISRTVYDYLN